MKTIIEFEDHGQDFLRWTLDAAGVVVDCGPFQAWVWNGTRVDLGTLRRGRVVFVLLKGARERTYIKYPVARIVRRRAA